jgi:hypothetical protein
MLRKLRKRRAGWSVGDSGEGRKGDNAEAIMLDFVNPAGTGGRRLRWRRQTGLNNPQTGTIRHTQRHVRLIGTDIQRV